MDDDRTESPGLGPGVAALGVAAADGGREGAPAAGPRRRQRRRPGGRHRQVKVRCSDEELAVLEGLASASGVSVPKLLLDGIFVRDGLTVAQRQSRYATFMATRRTVAGLATNLNHAARWANTEHQVPPGLDATLDAVQASLAALDRAIEDLLA